MRTYYELTEFMSNSDMGMLDVLLSGREERNPPNLQHIFDFGNLVDTNITERHKVNLSTGVMDMGYGRFVTFEQQDIKLAELMRRAYEADADLQVMCACMVYQHVVLRLRFPVEHQGYGAYVRARCKFDGLDKRRNLGLDIKTTAATSQAAFIQAFYHFDYDRQCAWYMDLAGIDRMIYVGLCKTKLGRNGLPLLFKHVVVRGDECYLSGLAKYQRLAIRYHLLVHNLLQDYVPSNQDISI